MLRRGWQVTWTRGAVWKRWLSEAYVSGWMDATVAELLRAVQPTVCIPAERRVGGAVGFWEGLCVCGTFTCPDQSSIGVSSHIRITGQTAPRGGRPPDPDDFRFSRGSGDFAGDDAAAADTLR